MFSLTIPRYFIDIYHQEEIGYFGILAMPITALGLIITFILQPNVVMLSTHLIKMRYHQFNKIVSKIILNISLIGAIILIGTYLVGVPVLNTIFGVDFTKYRITLLIIVFGAIMNAYVTVYINILTIMRRFKSQFYMLLITNLILLGACILYIKQTGLIGGVILFSIVNIIQLCCVSLTYKKTLRRIDAETV